MGHQASFREQSKGVEVECCLYNNHYLAEMAIRRGLSVLGPETLWLDFPCVAILLCLWIFLCHCSPFFLCKFLKQFNRNPIGHWIQRCIGDKESTALSWTSIRIGWRIYIWLCTSITNWKLSVTEGKAARWNWWLYCWVRIKNRSLHLVSHFVFNCWWVFFHYVILKHNQVQKKRLISLTT